MWRSGFRFDEFLPFYKNVLFIRLAALIHFLKLLWRFVGYHGIGSLETKCLEESMANETISQTCGSKLISTIISPSDSTHFNYSTTSFCYHSTKGSQFSVLSLIYELEKLATIQCVWNEVFFSFRVNIVNKISRFLPFSKKEIFGN